MAAVGNNHNKQGFFALLQQANKVLLIFIYLFTWLLAPLQANAQSHEALEAFNKNPVPFAVAFYSLAGTETLASLAKAYNLTSHGLKRLNPNLAKFSALELLPKGTKILLPKAKLSPEIAKYFEATPLSAMARINNSKSLALPVSPLSHLLSQSAEGLISKQSGAFFDSALHYLAANSMEAAAGGLSNWLGNFGLLNLAADFDKNWQFGTNLDLLLPLYDKPKNLIFTQAAYRYQKDKKRLNIGIGDRYFFENSALGVNGFFDHQFEGSYNRLGVGAEYMRNYLRLSLNGYFGLPSWNESELTGYLARPAHGFDIMLEGYMPFHPQLGLKAGFEQYFGQEVALFDAGLRSKNPNLYTLGLSYTPIPLIKLKFDYYQALQQSWQTKIGVDVSYRFAIPLAQQFSFNEVEPLRRLQGSRYELVNRNHNIVLDYKKEVIEANRFIKGLGSEVKAVFQSVEVAKDYKIFWKDSAPFEQAGGKLLPECYQIKDLSTCKVSLPVHKGGEADDEYQLDFVLQNSKGEIKQTVPIHITVMKDSIRLYQNIKGEERDEFLLISVKESLLSENIVFDHWDLPKAFEDNRGLLSSECKDVRQFSACKVILPLHDGASIDNRYSLSLHLKHRPLKEEGRHFTKANGEVTATTEIIVKKPAPEILDVEEKVTGYSGQILKLIKRVQLNKGWIIKDWKGLEPILERKGGLTQECFTIEGLANCAIIFPENSTPYVEDHYSLEAMLYNEKTDRQKQATIQIEVKKAKPDFVEVNDKISGYKGQYFNVFKDIYLNAKEWRIVDISHHTDFNRLGGILTPECEKIETLPNCRIKLPAYDGKYQDNRYWFTFTLLNDKTGQKRTEKIFYIVYPELVLIPYNPLKGKQKTQHKAFQKVEKQIYYWQNKGWNLPEDFVKNGGMISPECLGVTDLDSCKITLPLHSGAEVEDRYELRLLVENTQKPEKREIDISCIVTPAPLSILEINNPIEGLPEKSYALIKRISLSPEIWRLDDWTIEEEFLTQGGSLSKDCQSLSHLQSCQVTLPKLDVSGKSKTYQVKLNLYNIEDQYARVEPVEIIVHPPRASEEASILTLSRDHLPFGQISEATLALKDENGLPIDIDPKDLGTMLELRLETKMKEDGRTVISPLHKKGYGLYGAQITGGQVRAQYYVSAYYYNHLVVRKPLLVMSSTIDGEKSKFYADAYQVPRGGTVALHFLVRNETGDALSGIKDLLNFEILTGQDSRHSLSNIEEVKGDEGHYRALLSADDEVLLELAPSVKAFDNNVDQVFDQLKLAIEFKGQLFDENNSQLKADSTEIASFDIEQKADRTWVHLYGYDQDKLPLTGYQNKLAFVVTDAEGKEIERLAVKEAQKGEYIALFQASDGTNYKKLGMYKVQVSFAGIILTGLEEQITISANKADPDPTKTKFDADRDKALLDNLEGYPVALSLKTYDGLGNVQNLSDEKLRFLIKNSQGEEVKDVALIEPQPKQEITGKFYQMKALKTGQYRVIVQYVKSANKVFDLAWRDFTFIDDRPGAASEISVEDPILAVNGSAHYKTKTLLNFYAVDPYGKPLDLALYSPNKEAFIKDLTLGISHNNVTLQGVYNLAHLEKNHYQFTIESDLVNLLKQPGDYQFSVLYKNKEVNDKFATVRFSANHAFPESPSVTPQKGHIDFSKGQTSAEFVFEFKTKEGYIQDDILSRLVPMVKRNNEDIAEEDISKIVKIENLKAGRYKLNFKPTEEADYIISLYFRVFDGATIEEGGLVDIKIPVTVRVREGGDNYDISEFSKLSLEGSGLLASYDPDKKLDRTNIRFEALNKDNEPSSGFAKRLSFVIKSLDTNKEVETISVRETEAGIYSAQLVSHKEEESFLPAGSYKLLVALDGNILGGIKEEFTIDANLSPIDSENSNIKLERDYALIESLKGLPLEVKIELREHFNQKQDPTKKDVQLIVRDKPTIKEDLAKITKKTDDSYEIVALKVGNYSLVLQEKTGDLYQDRTQESLYFFDDRPADNSVLKIDQPIVAVNGSAGYQIKTKVKFTALTPFGQPLDLGQYSSDKNAYIKGLTLLVDFGNQEFGLPVEVRHIGGANYEGEIGAANAAGSTLPGTYKVRVKYSDEFLKETSHELVSSANHALPEQNLAQSAEKAVELGKDVLLTFTYSTIEGYPQDDINQYLVYHIYKDGKLVTEDESFYIQRQSAQGNQYNLNFAVKSKDKKYLGKYEIIAAYKRFNGTASDDYVELKPAVTIQMVENLDDFIFDANNSKFDIEKEAIATIDKNKKTDRSPVYLEAKNIQNEPALGLLEKGLKFLVKNEKGEVISTLTPEDEGEGRYSAIFTSALGDDKYKVPGLYYVEAALNEKIKCQDKIKIDPDLAETSLTKTAISLDRKVAILESFDGLPLKLRIEPKDDLGNPQSYAKQDLQIKILDDKDKPSEQSARIETQKEELNAQNSLIYASKEGDYFLSVETRNKEDKKFYRISAQPIIFTKGIPDDKSALSFKDPIIATDDKGGYISKTEVRFAPILPEDPKLSYKDLLKEGSQIFRLYYKQGETLYPDNISLEADQTGLYKAVIDGNKIVTTDAGEFLFYLVYGPQKEIKKENINAVLTISPDYTFPSWRESEAYVEPEDGNIKLNETGKFYFKLRTSSGFEQKAIPMDRIKFELTRNGTMILADEAKKYITILPREEGKDNLYGVSFKAVDLPGKYGIRIYYKKYSDNEYYQIFEEIYLNVEE